jgi:asparagine synthase (glutamine-hydrolysing)
MIHRGPNSKGSWCDKSAGIALAHRRLSILDLSNAGHQPMLSNNQRWVICYNGEIYNHNDIRKEIEKADSFTAWRGRSDVETLLTAIQLWGLESTLSKLNGMFAFALWDRKCRQLYLARDRCGEKPLYYGYIEKSFVFGSEIKALAKHPKWQGEIDRDSLALFMRYNHVPAPRSIYKKIYKLPPAHYLVVSSSGQTAGKPICYWSLPDVAINGVSRRRGSAADLSAELDGLIRSAVGMRMLSDVPIGAFLSGGYDSAMIVAQMQAQSAHPVRTFSIGSEEEKQDEAPHAAMIAQYIGTNHTELYVSAENALSIIPKLPTIHDEPFADSSQIPTFLVSELAKRDVTVALSGDGGDELFAGYYRHFAGVKLWQHLRRLPLGLRQNLSKILGGTINCSPSFSLRLCKLISALNASDGNDFYDQLKAHWKTPNVVIGASDLSGYRGPVLEGVDFLDQMLLMDMNTYLPDDILTKIDRASMATSLEARVPFLDHRLIEFSWRVPMEFKVRNGRGKWLLRKVLGRYVPPKLMDRPKQGFGVPLSTWLRGPLRNWAEVLLDEKRIRNEGFLNETMVGNSWQMHLAGRGHEEHNLWAVLMFQSWLESHRN